MLILSFLLLFLLPNITKAETHTFDWTLTEIQANPDGLFPRQIIAVNEQWPFPVIKIKQEDRIIVHLKNNLKEDTSLHFHGIFQNNSTYMDGAAMISQCPIQPGDSFTYNFTVHQTGTYWYHSHSAAQYGDGFRGILIVEPKEEDKVYDYEDNIVISLSDWYHTPASVYVEQFFVPGSRGSEPSIDSSLFNESSNVDIHVQPDTSYYLRVINVGMSATQYFYIEDHDLTIIEVDGVNVEPTVVDSLKLSTGQRYGVLLKTKPTAEKNYQVVQATNVMMRKLYSVNNLIYNKDLPKSSATHKNANDLVFMNDFDIKPLGDIKLLPEPDHEIVFHYSSNYFTKDHIRYYTMNDKPHISPKIPTVNTVFSANLSTVSNPQIYGEATSAFLLKGGDIVQIVVNSDDHMRHPFHLHGHNFQVISRGRREHFDSATSKKNFPSNPVIRDTVEVPGRGYVVLRFIADNPGVWFFHCHTEWHAVQGLGVVFVEDGEGILNNQILPRDNVDVCERGGYKGLGNAAGNEDLFNMTGEIKPLIPYGQENYVDTMMLSSTTSSKTTTILSSISDAAKIVASSLLVPTTSATSTTSTKSSQPTTIAGTEHVPSHPHHSSTKEESSTVSFATQAIVIAIYGSFMAGVVFGFAWIVNYLIKKRSIVNKRELVENNFQLRNMEDPSDNTEDESIPLRFMKKDDED